MAENYYNKEDYLGNNYGFLVDLLKGRIGQGLTNKSELFAFDKKAIEDTIGASRAAIAEDFTSRGTFGGTGMAQINANLAKSESMALGKVLQGYSLMDENVRSQAIAQLLGLNQFEGQLGFSVDQAENQKNLNWSQFFEQQRQFNKGMDARPSAFMQLLGNIIGGGAQVGSAALLAASDRRFKENIDIVGSTKDNIPIVEFNYIGNSKRYVGVIAQDVEKVNPSAVLEIGGYKFVDYSQIEV